VPIILYFVFLGGGEERRVRKKVPRGHINLGKKVGGKRQKGNSILEEKRKGELYHLKRKAREGLILGSLG